MSKECTITTAVEELQKFFILLNHKYFGGELEMPIITLNTDTTPGAYGWITVNKVWNSKEGEWYREINLCAEHLHRDTELIISTLLHEMCHLYNIQHGIKDTSRGGRYHNKEFKHTAEKYSLIVEKCEKNGYCITKPTPELIAFVEENVNADCFDLERIKTYKGGKQKVTKQSTKKYICPVCDLIVRASKDITGRLKCVDCDEVLIES